MNIVGRKVVLTCAVTGGTRIPPRYPEHLEYPVTPEQIAHSALDAAAAGASVVHIHARDPETRAGSTDVALFAEICARYRTAGGTALVNLTCGSGAEFWPDPNDEAQAGPGTNMLSAAARVAHLVECRPDLCSIDVTTASLDEGDGDFVYLNTPRTLRAMAEMMRELGVKPEIEIYHPGDIRLAQQMIAEDVFDQPPLFQFVLGARWANPADTATLLYLRDSLPPGSTWAAFGISAAQMPMVAQSALLGGHVRVGLEDNVYIRRGEFATNRQLVEHAVALVESLGGSVATPDEARTILGLPGG